jgi:hypothetical protein
VKLVVGLGNVGQEFEKTRHNVGFMAVDALAGAHDATWQHQAKFFAYTAQVELDGHRVLLAKPDTLMNRSGKAVQALAHYHKCDLSDVIVISDDLDLVFGKVRVRIGGSSGGQNGLKSIIELVGEGFVAQSVDALTPVTMYCNGLVLMSRNTLAASYIKLVTLLVRLLPKVQSIYHTLFLTRPKPKNYTKTNEEAYFRTPHTSSQY